MPLSKLNILWIEDNMADITLFQEALAELEIKRNLHIVSDGNEAINYLYRKNQFADAVCPDIIMLDLNLPQKNGKEIIEEIRSNKQFKDIPMVILTSIRHSSFMSSIEPHRITFIQKAINYIEIKNIIKKIDDFWLSLTVN